MSYAIDPRADSEAEIREQLADVTEPYMKSKQAQGKPESDLHNDGEALHYHFNTKPFHKYLAKADRNDAQISEYPGAFVDNVVYLTDRDVEILRHLADEGEVDYDHGDPHVSHPELERHYDNPYRAKVMEWLADDADRVNDLRAIGGTDMWAHGEPGGGKTTLFLSAALWRMEVNNETFIWAESLDESGTNERTEWLAFAPFTTIAAPAGLDPTVRIVPQEPTVQPFEVDLEDIARDVIYYNSIQDLMKRLVPGQFYVVYPDPLHRGADSVSQYNYFSYRETTPEGEEGPTAPTPADQWWFAFFSHRISGDVFVHPTFVNIDEAGNLLDPDAKKDDHQTYQKIKWLKNKYADARKKGLSFGYQTHALAELNDKLRAKIRWRITMNGNSPPVGSSSLPGGRSCPMLSDKTKDMDPGEAQIWKAPNWAKITWPNLKSDARLDAKVSIDFQRWQDAVGGT